MIAGIAAIALSALLLVACLWAATALADVVGHRLSAWLDRRCRAVATFVFGPDEDWL